MALGSMALGADSRSGKMLRGVYKDEAMPQVTWRRQCDDLEVLQGRVTHAANISGRKSLHAASAWKSAASLSCRPVLTLLNAIAKVAALRFSTQVLNQC